MKVKLIVCDFLNFKFDVLYIYNIFKNRKIHKDKFYKNVYYINNIFFLKIYNIFNNNNLLKFIIKHKLSNIIYDMRCRKMDT